MKKVKLTKIAETEDPLSPAGDWEFYKLGQFNNGKSLPIEYTLHGFLLMRIEVGHSMRIKRTHRNGLEIDGLFVSSPVQSINGKLICTMNSKYLLENL